jgi:RNA polymerase sigma factor for flagellar operon FliA
VNQQIAHSQDCRIDLVAPHAPLMSCIAQEIARQVLPDVEERDRIGVTLFCLIVAASRVEVPHENAHGDADSQASWCAIIDELSDRGILPGLVRDTCRHLGMEVIAMEKLLGRPLRANERADILKISIDQYHDLQREVNALLLFDREDATVDGDDGNLLLEILGEGNGLSTQLQSSRYRLVDSLARTIDGLPEQEMMVVNLFYNEELSLEEIGDLLGLDEPQVSKLHSQAIVRLRAQFRHYC